MKIATLRYRKVPAIKKKLQPIKDWISIEERLAGRTYPTFAEPITPIPAEEMRAVLDDKARWTKFARRHHLDVLEFVCRSLGILEVRTVSELPYIPRAPSFAWRQQFPILTKVHGLELV